MAGEIGGIAIPCDVASAEAAEAEVAAVFEVPLDFLLDAANHRQNAAMREAALASSRCARRPP